MKKLTYSTVLCACAMLSACTRTEYSIDTEYVKNCNDKGGKVERIEYSEVLQCVGANSKELTK